MRGLGSVTLLCNLLAVSGKVAVFGGGARGQVRRVYDECEYLEPEEKEECKERTSQSLSKLPWWTWLILGSVLAVILLVISRMMYVRCTEEDKGKDPEHKRRKRRRSHGCGWTQSIRHHERKDKRKGSSSHSNSADHHPADPEQGLPYHPQPAAGAQQQHLQVAAGVQEHRQAGGGGAHQPQHVADAPPHTPGPPTTRTAYHNENRHQLHRQEAMENTPPIQMYPLPDTVPYAQVRKSDRSSIYV